MSPYQDFTGKLPNLGKFTVFGCVAWYYLPRTDNGGEFTSSDLDEFCEEFAVKRSFSVPYAPPQNAHAERMWGILLRTVRITIAESKISERAGAVTESSFQDMNFRS